MSTEEIYDFQDPYENMDEPEDFNYKIILEARKCIGMVEDPPNSDRTPIGEWAEKHGGDNGVAWCANGASMWVYLASNGKVVLCKGWKDTGVFSAGCDHVPSIERWAKSQGIFVDKTEVPEQGFLILADEMNKGHATHIGVVESTDRTRVTTIEANYSDKCLRLRRSKNDRKIIGYVDLTTLFA